MSTVLKGVISVNAINILAGAILKVISRIAGPEGIKGLISGLINLKEAAAGTSLIFGEFASASGGLVAKLQAAAGAAATLGVSL